jgi:predicted phage baseplate assembly protein
MLEVETDREGTYEAWQEVADFAASGPDDRHYTLDGVTGEVQFGPLIRQPSGQERSYGRIPPRGRMLRFTSYRWGGGSIGNVGDRTITVLKSSVPYVASVTNFTAAVGGSDAETLERAKVRAPSVVRARTRAVTAEDFECLALEASPLVARARCVAAGAADGHGPPPGVVRLLLVPAISDTARLIPADELELPRRLREDVQTYLDERRLLATHLEIGSPAYQPIGVVARVKAKDGTPPAEVARGIEERLYGYINPVTGGSHHTGLDFGRGVTLSEVYAAIQGAAGLDYVEDVKLHAINRETGERQEAATRVAVPADGLVCSAKHEVIAV